MVDHHGDWGLKQYWEGVAINYIGPLGPHSFLENAFIVLGEIVRAYYKNENFQ